MVSLFLVDVYVKLNVLTGGKGWRREEGLETLNSAVWTTDSKSAFPSDHKGFSLPNSF